MSPELQLEVGRARSVLQSTNVQKRQIDQKRLRAVTSTRWATVRFLLYSALFGAPLLVCLVTGILFANGRAQLAIAGAVCSGPLIAFVGAALLGLFAVRRRVRRLKMSALAVPPSREGAPFGCHVCGGDLALPPDSGAIARCSYCAADNVVSSGSLIQQGTDQVHRLGNIAVGVGREAHAVHDASERFGLSMALATVAAPFFGVVVSLVLLCGLMQFDVAPSTDELYAVVETPAGRCLGEYIYGGTTIHFGDPPPEGVEKSVAAIEAEVVETLRAGDLVGREVFWFARGQLRRGRILDVVGLLPGGNMAIITNEPRRGLRGLCFAEPSTELSAR